MKGTQRFGIISYFGGLQGPNSRAWGRGQNRANARGLYTRDWNPTYILRPNNVIDRLHQSSYSVRHAGSTRGRTVLVGGTTAGKKNTSSPQLGLALKSLEVSI